MSDSVAMWLLGPVLAVGSFIATCAALFYAHLAYRSSVKNTEQARAAELTTLKIQAKTGMGLAQRSLQTLQPANKKVVQNEEYMETGRR